MLPFAVPFPEIDPVLVEIGPFAIRWYALAYIAGILFAWWYIRRLLADEALWAGTPRPSRADIDDFVLWATVGIVLGGRLGFVLFYNLDYYLQHPGQILAVWQGGMAFHGGFLGVVVAMILFARRRRLNLWTLFDVVAAAVPIGLFFGRIANFINAELWGRVSDVPWAMVFPTVPPALWADGENLPRHPSQLYEALLEGLVLFLVLRLVTHRWNGLQRPGLVAGVFVVGYGAARSIAEQFREPDIQLGFLAGGLTMGTLLSLPMMAVGAWAIWRASTGRTAARPAA